MVLCAVALLLLSGCAGQVNSASQINGYIFPSADIQPTHKLHIRVALLDVSKMDVSATVISEAEFQSEPSWPLQYKLSYDPDFLDQRLTYGISVRVSSNDGQLLAINDFSHQFTINADSRNFDVLVKPVGIRVSSLAEFDMACAEIEYRVSIYKSFLVRYDRENMSRQIFIQKRAASGVRYERESEVLLLKGNFPPLYLKAEDKITCSTSVME